MNRATYQEADAPRSPLLIVGASARAAAFSAKRAGLTPWAADLFADRDLACACPEYRRVADYPRGVLEIARQGPAGPWMYTGALENVPALVEELSRQRPLWGNPAAVLRRVRCPVTVAHVLREHGIAAPAVLDGCVLPATGCWLRKPKASASGRGITVHSVSQATGTARCYLQEYLEGEACSALYSATDGRARLLGMTHQIVGENWLHARPFRYCGSIGPIAMSRKLHGGLERLGEVLTSAFELRGLFGVDFILRDDIPWPVEINPRYTASVEVLEWTTGQSALALHAGAFVRPAAATSPAAAPGMLGKAIYHAPASLRFPTTGPWEDALRLPWDAWRVPAYADIPAPDEPFDTGQPVLTCFASGATMAECREKLRRIAGDLDRRLFSR